MERLTPSPHLSPLGQTLSLSCSYDAIPTPSVTWMRDAEVLSDDNRTSVTLDTDSFSSELTLDELEREEGGVYVCLFTNEVGSGVSSIVVTVQGTSYRQSLCHGDSSIIAATPTLSSEKIPHVHHCVPTSLPPSPSWPRL